MGSLATRIGLSATIVLGIFIVVTGISLDRAFHESARSVESSRLLSQIYLLMAAAKVNRKGQLSMPDNLQEARFNLPDSGLYGRIIDANGNTVWQSSSSMGITLPATSALAAGKKIFSARQDAGHTYFSSDFGVRWAVDKNNYPFTFTVIEDSTAYQAQLSHYRQSLWMWLGIMAVLLLLAQAIVLRWWLRPLRRVVRELNFIDDGRQDIIEGEYPTELKQITDRLNALIRHERARQTRSRNALADLAHSLKTPLAVLRGSIGEGKFNEKSVRLMDEQINQMDRTVRHQLQRVETGEAAIVMHSIDAALLIRKLVSVLEKVYRDKNIHCAKKMSLNLKVLCDERDFMELAGNLLDNAFKYCRSKVALSADRENGHIAIDIEDDGPGFEVDEIKHILQRGGRLDQSKPGQGIGLTVAKEIIDAYRGRLELKRSVLGGAHIRVLIPEHLR